jgi:hypothetical protein
MTDVEIVVDRIKNNFANYFITNKYENFSLMFYGPRYSFMKMIVVNLGSKEHEFIVSFFSKFLRAQKSIDTSVCSSTKETSCIRIKKVEKPSGVYYAGIKKLKDKLSNEINSNTDKVHCFLSQKYKVINLNPSIIDSFVKYLYSLQNQIDEDVFKKIIEEVNKPFFYSSKRLYCSVNILIRLDHIF